MSKLLVFLALAAAVSSSHVQQYLPPRAAFSSASAYSSSSAQAQAYATASARASSAYENSINHGDGAYRYSYETGNGISAHESGSAAGAGAAAAAEGGFSYRAPDGQQIALTYTADERGFRPSGAHLPTPPPVPEAILRSIEFNRRNPSSDEGSYTNNNNEGGYQY